MSRPIKNGRTRVAVSNNSASFAAFTDVNFADATDGYASTAIGEHILASVGTLCNLFQMTPFSLIRAHQFAEDRGVVYTHCDATEYKIQTGFARQQRARTLYWLE